MVEAPQIPREAIDRAIPFMIKSIKEGNIDMLRKILGAHFPPNEELKDKQTPLVKPLVLAAT